MGDDMFAMDLFAEMYTPDEALKEVARMNGNLSWALLGGRSFASELVLLECGTGADEFPKAINKTTRSFGLSRMVIGTPPSEQTVFVYVNFVRQGADSTGVKQNEEMEKVIDAYTTVTVKLNIDSVDQLTPDRVWRMLFNPEQFEENNAEGPTRSKASRGSDDDEWLDGLVQTNESDDWLGKVLEKNVVDHSESDVSSSAYEEDRDRFYTGESQDKLGELRESRRPASEKLTSARRGRNSLPPGAFRQGDLVNVFSKDQRFWHQDGKVLLRLAKDARLDGFGLEAGSVKVQYGEGKRFKWLSPAMQDVLMRSGCPKPPEQIVGELYKRTGGCCFTTWHTRYVELRLGFLQWWASEDEVKADLGAKSIIYLFGMKLVKSGTVLTLSVATKKTQYRFDATNEEAAQLWEQHLKKHADHCELMREYLQSHEHQSLQMQWPASLDHLKRGTIGHFEMEDEDGFV